MIEAVLFAVVGLMAVSVVMQGVLIFRRRPSIDLEALQLASLVSLDLAHQLFGHVLHEWQDGHPPTDETANRIQSWQSAYPDIRQTIKEGHL